MCAEHPIPEPSSLSLNVLDPIFGCVKEAIKHVAIEKNREVKLLLPLFSSSSNVSPPSHAHVRLTPLLSRSTSLIPSASRVAQRVLHLGQMDRENKAFFLPVQRVRLRDRPKPPDRGRSGSSHQAICNAGLEFGGPKLVLSIWVRAIMKWSVYYLEAQLDQVSEMAGTSHQLLPLVSSQFSQQMEDHPDIYPNMSPWDWYKYAVPAKLRS